MVKKTGKISSSVSFTNTLKVSHMNLFLTFFLVRIFYLIEKYIFSLKECKNDYI